VENKHYCPHLLPGNEVVQYSADSNLFFLREDLADELGAVIGYLECAALAYHSKVSEQFSRIADEETGHFIRLMQMISSLDPVQAEQLKQQELTVLTLMNDGVKPPGTVCGNCSHSKDPRLSEHKNYPKERYEKSNVKELELLGNAIRDELRAVNAYQKQVQITANQSIQNLLIIIMNQEKEHLAKFVRLFHDLQH
jgi:rubrerythrin